MRDFGQIGCFLDQIPFSPYLLHTSTLNKDILEERRIGKEAIDLCTDQREEFFPTIVAQGFLKNNGHLLFHILEKTSLNPPSSKLIMYTLHQTQGLKLICSFQSIPREKETGEGRELRGQQSLLFSKLPTWKRKRMESAVLQRPPRERVANAPMGS